jgi:hypothetical protein
MSIREPLGFVHELDEQLRLEEIFDISFILPGNIRREIIRSCSSSVDLYRSSSLGF